MISIVLLVIAAPFLCLNADSVRVDCIHKMQKELILLYRIQSFVL